MESNNIKVFNLPDGCPVPGAIYRRQLSDGRWEFATITALEVLPADRWCAVLSSIRYGDERITSEINRMSKFELHSVPNMLEVSDIIAVKDDELDMLLSVGA